MERDRGSASRQLGSSSTLPTRSHLVRNYSHNLHGLCLRTLTAGLCAVNCRQSGRHADQPKQSHQVDEQASRKTKAERVYRVCI